MFKIEGERGLYTLFEEDSKGVISVTHGDHSITCYVRGSDIAAEDCSDIPTLFEYGGFEPQLVKNPIGWNPYRDVDAA
jgi:hypothetical protein